MPLILVTNDDGVHAPGIKALYGAMREIGQPIVVAPERDNSAVSHSLTMNRPLRVKKLEAEIFTIDGTPTDCVMIGMEKILPGRPALIVSGINAGGNLCDDISYSGTVSAAVEGTMLGIPSLAISMSGEEPFDFARAALVAKKLALMVLAKGLPADTLLNINVPNHCPVEAPLCFTRQGRRHYHGAIMEIHDPWKRKHYWIGGGTPIWDQGEHTDSQVVMANRISITPIHLDLTNHAALAFLRDNWEL